MKYVVLALAVVGVFISLDALAIDLPNYANAGNLNTELQSKGKKITDTVSMVAVIISIIGLLIGAVFIGGGNADSGKRWVIGGLTGIVLAGTVYGIASLVA